MTLPPMDLAKMKAARTIPAAEVDRRARQHDRQDFTPAERRPYYSGSNR